jgi:transcriptional regulator with XRE-family HTH domain
MNLGSQIRQHRKEKRLTLKVVAERAEISEGFLSQVENSTSSPSVDTLISISNAIGVNAGDLLNQVSAKEILAIVHKTEWDDIEVPKAGFATRRFLSPESRAVIDSAVLFLKPEKVIPIRKDIKNGQEVLCVLRGTLELVHGEQVIHLAEGDAVHLYANTASQYIVNRGNEVTVVLWVGTL